MLECDVAIITGSGFYDFPELEEAYEVEIATPYGTVRAIRGSCEQTSILFIARHKENHALLSNMVNHRANIHACGQAGVKVILATSIVGLTRADLPLARLLVFNDIFYPDNRLPDGSHCTFYTKENQQDRGHYLFSSPFFNVSGLLRDLDTISGLTYGHVNGPRFNSKKEIRFISGFADAVSQTAGPEAILAGELEIPYVLLGYGVDYANGVKSEPTPMEVLTENMHNSKMAFAQALKVLISQKTYQFSGYVYRFS